MFMKNIHYLLIILFTFVLSCQKDPSTIGLAEVEDVHLEAVNTTLGSNHNNEIPYGYIGKIGFITSFYLNSSEGIIEYEPYDKSNGTYEIYNSFLRVRWDYFETGIIQYDTFRLELEENKLKIIARPCITSIFQLNKK